MTHSRIRALVSALLTLVAAPVLAQEGAGASAPVTIALVSRSHYRDAEVAIVRRSGTSPHDVIIVTRGSLRARALADAVEQLVLLRARDGAVPAANALFRVRVDERARPLDGPASAWVATLRHASRMTVPGIGEVPAITITPPERRTR